MAGSDGASRPSARVQKEAVAWFGKLRGPDGERLREAFERWRAANPAHVIAYAEVEAMWRQAGALGSTEVGRNRQLPLRRPRLFEMPFVRPALAGLFVLVVAGIAFVLLGARTTAPIMMAHAAPLTTRVGEIRTLKLADGSTVTLDTDSSIIVQISEASRDVRLVRGRARFDVASDTQRRFRVEAGGRSITAAATTFDIGLEADGARISIFRGQADVTAAGPAEGRGAVTRLGVGDCLSGAGAKASVTRLSQEAGQWVTGMLSFDGTPLAQVLDQTNRYSAAKIRLGSRALEGLQVTGAFRPLPVRGLAESLAATFSLKVKQLPDGGFLLLAS